MVDKTHKRAVSQLGNASRNLAAAISEMQVAATALPLHASDVNGMVIQLQAVNLSLLELVAKVQKE